MERDQAKALGLKYYSTGRPCKHGHKAPRYTNSAGCIAIISWRANKIKGNASLKELKLLVKWLESKI